MQQTPPQRVIVVELFAFYALEKELDCREAPDAVLLAEGPVVLRVYVDVDEALPEGGVGQRAVRVRRGEVRGDGAGQD